MYFIRALIAITTNFLIQLICDVHFQHEHLQDELLSFLCDVVRSCITRCITELTLMITLKLITT